MNNQTALSMKVFASYMVFVVGSGLMLFPHLLLGLFNLTAGDDLWVRMLGLLAFILGCNYFVMVKIQALELIRGSVWLRFFAAGFMVVLVLLGKAGLPLLIFALVDFMAATWTCISLRSSTNRSAS